MAGFTTTDRELSLQELLADPIVQTMMDNDGVTKEDVTGLLRSMRERMASRADEHHKTGRAQGAWKTGMLPSENAPRSEVFAKTPTPSFFLGR